MWDRYLKIGVTLMLDILNDAPERSKHRKMLLKVFRTIGEAFAQDKEFRDAANAAFSGK